MKPWKLLLIAAVSKAISWWRDRREQSTGGAVMGAKGDEWLERFRQLLRRVREAIDRRRRRP